MIGKVNANSGWVPKELTYASTLLNLFGNFRGLAAYFLIFRSIPSGCLPMRKLQTKLLTLWETDCYCYKSMPRNFVHLLHSIIVCLAYHFIKHQKFFSAERARSQTKVFTNLKEADRYVLLMKKWTVISLTVSPLHIINSVFSFSTVWSGSSTFDLINLNLLLILLS